LGAQIWRSPPCRRTKIIQKTPLGFNVAKSQIINGRTGPLQSGDDR